VYQFPTVPASTCRREGRAWSQNIVTVGHPQTFSSMIAHEHSRTEFTEGDDEHLCRYIAEVLPDKAEGGRTGHFIYADLIRRVSAFYTHSPYFSSPFRQTNSVNTPGHVAIPKMAGVSAIAKIRSAWTTGLPRSLKETHLHPTGKGNISTGGMEGSTRTLN